MSDGEISGLSSDEELRLARHLQDEADARAFLAHLEAREAAEEAGSSASAPAGRRKVKSKRGAGRRPHRARSMLMATSGKYQWDVKSGADRGHPGKVRVHPVVRPVVKRGRPRNVPVPVVSSETDDFSDVSSTDWEPPSLPALPVWVPAPVPVAVPVTVHRATIIQGGRPITQNERDSWGYNSTDSGSVDTMSSCLSADDEDDEPSEPDEPDLPDLNATLTPAQLDEAVEVSSADEVFLSPAPKQRIAEGKFDIFNFGKFDQSRSNKIAPYNWEFTE
jgi:hypothetical protein